jgi:hypothetical protein
MAANQEADVAGLIDGPCQRTPPDWPPASRGDVDDRTEQAMAALRVGAGD